MNYAGMLVEARGAPFPPNSGTNIASQEDASRVLIQSRLEDLKKAESLYSRVSTHGSVMSQQQNQSAPSEKNAGVDQASGSKVANVGQEMANFAQEALGTVQMMIKQLLEESNKLQGGKV